MILGLSQLSFEIVNSFELASGSQLPGQYVGSKCVYRKPQVLGACAPEMVQMVVISEGQHARAGLEPNFNTQPVNDWPTNEAPWGSAG